MLDAKHFSGLSSINLDLSITSEKLLIPYIYLMTIYPNSLIDGFAEDDSCSSRILAMKLKPYITINTFLANSGKNFTVNFFFPCENTVDIAGSIILPNVISTSSPYGTTFSGSSKTEYCETCRRHVLSSRSSWHK